MFKNSVITLSLQVAQVNTNKVLALNYSILAKKWGKHCKDEHGSFMESLHQRLDHQAMVDDLANLGAEVELQYDPYEDESQNVKMFPSLDEEPKATQSGRLIFKQRDTTPWREKVGQGQSSMSKT